MTADTKPEVFIIESLSLDDEEAERQEGKLISQMLRLAGKTETKYYYIRTQRELDEIVDLFDESNFRYLHLSCHAKPWHMSSMIESLHSGQSCTPLIAADPMASRCLDYQAKPSTGGLRGTDWIRPLGLWF